MKGDKLELAAFRLPFRSDRSLRANSNAIYSLFRAQWANSSLLGGSASNMMNTEDYMNR